MRTACSWSLIAFLLLLVFLDFCISSTENGSQSSLEKETAVKISNKDPMRTVDVGRVDEMKKDEDENGGSQGETKEGDGKNDAKGSANEAMDKLDEETKVKDESGKGSNGGDSQSESGPVKTSRVEECDPSNRCNDEKNKFVACLRVPGEDSSYLSLLVQNKGAQSLSLNILAPDFVNLEQTTVQLQPKEHKEVTVSLKGGANGTIILQKAGEGNCSLHFQNMIPTTMKRSATSSLSRYTILRTPKYFFYFAVCIVAILGFGLGFWREQRKGAPGYQKAEMGLPISTGGKKEASDADEWDSSWGDGWYDEEAPMTPSKPASTPSSKGLASRRLIKDGWKD